jgi:hypothetical protein
LVSPALPVLQAHNLQLSKIKQQNPAQQKALAGNERELMGLHCLEKRNCYSSSR